MSDLQGVDPYQKQKEAHGKWATFVWIGSGLYLFLAGDDVRSLLCDGEEISSYPDDTPYPSCVMLGFIDGRAVHVVVAREENTRTCYAITVYRPHPDLWESDFKRRRP